MTTPIQRPAVYEDLFDLPDTVVGEIINGQISSQPRPSPKHSLAGLALPSVPLLKQPTTPMIVEKHQIAQLTPSPIQTLSAYFDLDTRKQLLMHALGKTMLD